MKDSFAHLLTPAGECLPAVPWNVYPRPQMVRDSFLCLNGAWELTVSHRGQTLYSGDILVPFSPETLLSGVHRQFPDGSTLCYRRTFSLPDGFDRGRVLLHFGAADQVAEVTFNGKPLGRHEGGYLPFSFDVTGALQPHNVLEVRVTDTLKDAIFPYGKQSLTRGGMWYTPQSGLWQTVWLESVCDGAVTALHIETDMAGADIAADGVTDGEVCVATPEGEMRLPLVGGHVRVEPEAPRLWSPETPYLYRFTLRAGNDEVRSYFALRQFDIREAGGKARLCLNGKPCFMHGLLDQGYYSDGLYTPADPVCFERDILAMKSCGFNMLRKHIKVEIEQFYYDCDRLGMLVWQDAVNNGRYSFLRDTALPTAGLTRLNDKHLHRHAETRRRFIEGMEQTVAHLRNHPCICGWTIFNEGWGQFDSAPLYRWLKATDPSRFVDTASGWFAGAPSDVDSKHIYFKPLKMQSGDKPLFLSEYGGYSYAPQGHVFHPGKNYGYRFFAERSAFEEALVRLLEEQLAAAVDAGLCGAVYTQVSDVEDETNGLLSYDRRVLKVDAARLRDIAAALQARFEKACGL